MAEEKTTIIAKVGAKIYPVTDQFYREAKRDLKRAEDRLDDVEVDVKLGDDKALNQLKELLRRLNEKAREGMDDIDTKLDEHGAEVDAKVLKKKLEKTLGNIKADVKLDQTKSIMDELQRPKTFQKLRHIEIFDPSSMRQYGKRIREINDQVRAGAKLDAQRARALAEQAREMQRLTDEANRAAREQAKIAEDQARAAKRQTDALEKAVKAQTALHKQLGDREFEKTAKNVRDILKEVDDEVRILDKRMDFKYRVKLEGMSDVERQIEDLKWKMSAAESKLNLSVGLSDEDRNKVIREIDSLRREIKNKTDDLPIKFDVNSPTMMLKYLSLKLDALGRNRIVHYIPMVSKAAAAKVATTLAALSGARLSGQLIEDMWDLVKNMDKAIPKLALVGTALGGVAAWALSAATNIFSLGAEFAKMGPAALGLPGILGGIAIGAAVTGIALKDLNKQLPEASKGWKSLKGAIRTNFWAQAEDPIRRLGKSLFPDLLAGIKGTSTEIGKFFSAFADGLRTELGGNPLRNMFADLNKSVDIFTDHAGNIAKIIRILGESGAGLLPRLAGYFGQITDRFSNFLDLADKDGSLQKWIDDGILAMRNFGKAVYQVGRFLGGLGSIANAAGGTTFEAIADTFKRAGDAVRESHFRELAIGALKAADEAMTEISKNSGPGVKKMFEALAETAVTVFPTIGKIIGESLGGIATALSRDGFQQGLKDFFDGILSLVRDLQPALGPLSDALGSMLTLAGRMAKAFGPVLSSLLTVVADVVNTIAPYVGDAVEALAGPFADLIKNVAPAVHDLADSAGPLLKKFADVVGDFVRQITPDVVATIKKIADFLGKKADQMNAEVMADIADSLAKIAKMSLHNLQRVIDFFDWLSTPDSTSGGNSGLADFVGLLGDLAEIADKAAGAVGTVFQTIEDQRKAAHEKPGGSNWDKYVKQVDDVTALLSSKQEWSDLGKQFTDAFKFLTDKHEWGQLGQQFKDATAFITSPKEWGELGKQFTDAFAFLTDPKQWSDLGAAVSSGWQSVLTAINDVPVLGDSLKTNWDNMLDGIFGADNDTWNKRGLEVHKQFTDAFSFLTDPQQWSDLGKSIKSGWDSVAKQFTDGTSFITSDKEWDGLGKQFTDAFAFLTDEHEWSGLAKQFTDATAFITSPKEWGELGQQFKDAFAFLTDGQQWSDLGAAISTGWNSMMAAVFGQDFWSNLGTTISTNWHTMWAALTSPEAWAADFESLKTTFHDIGVDILAGLQSGFVDSVQPILDWWNGFLNGMIDFVKGILGIHSPSTVFADIGGFLISGLAQGLGRTGPLTTALSTLSSMITGKFSGSATWLVSPGVALLSGLIGGIAKKYGDVKEAAKTALQRAKDGTDGAGGSLKQAGIDVIDGFVRWIENGFSKVQGVLNRLTDLLPSWKGPRSTDKVILKEAGQLVIQGFVEGLTSQFGLVKNVLGDLSDDIAGTQLAAPTIGKINSADVAKLRAGVSAQVAVAGDAVGQAPVAEAPIVFNIENHNPVAEPTSVTTTKALRTAGQMGVLRK